MTPNDFRAMSDEQLAELAYKGSSVKDVQNLLCDRYLDKAWRWVSRYGLSEEDAEDVGQDALIEMIRSLPRFHDDGQGYSFRRWFFVIVRNKVYMWLRKRDNSTAERGDLDDELVDDAGAGFADRIIREVDIELALKDAPPHYQRVYELMRDGFSDQAIADELDLTIDQVYRIKYEIRKRL